MLFCNLFVSKISNQYLFTCDEIDTLKMAWGLRFGHSFENDKQLLVWNFPENLIPKFWLGFLYKPVSYRKNKVSLVWEKFEFP